MVCDLNHRLAISEASVEILRSVNLEGERLGSVRDQVDPLFSDFTILATMARRRLRKSL
jgi:hypothetical protein